MAVSECHPLEVWIDQPIQVSVGISCMTAPWVILRKVNHMSANWVEFDVAIAIQAISIGVNQRGFVPALPQGAAAPVPSVEVTNIFATEVLHQSGYAIRNRGSD